MKKLNISKKLAIMFFVIFSLFTTNLSAKTKNSNDITAQEQQVETIVMNEYLLLKERMSVVTNDLILKPNATNLKEYQMISKAVEDYPNFINSINAAYSDEQLKNVNYSDKQIWAIRNFDGSEKMLIMASSNITANTGLVYYSYSNPYTSFSSRVTFNISGFLSWYYTNHIAVSLAPSINMFQPIDAYNRSSQVTYKNVNTGATQSKATTPMGDNSINGAYQWSFDTRLDYDVFISSVTATVSSKVQGLANFVVFRFAYGEASWTGDAGIEFGLSTGGPSIGISLSPKQNTVLYPSNPDSRVRTFYY